MIEEKQKTSEEEADEQEKKESYHVAEYVKEHTGFAVACISGGIAVTSTFISILSLVYQHICLQDWRISTWDLISTDKGSVYFSFALGFIYLVILYCTSSAAEFWLTQYYQEKAIILYNRAVNRYLEKEVKEPKRRIKKLKRRVRKLKRKASIKELEDLDSEVEKISVRIQGFTEEIKQIKKKIRSGYIFLVLYMFFVLFAVSLLTFLALFIFQAITGDISWSILPLWGLTFLEIVLPASFAVKSREAEIAPQTVKATIQKKREEGGESISELLEEARRLLDETEKEHTGEIFISDRMLKNFGTKLLISFFTLFLVVTLSAAIEKKGRDTVWLYVTPEKSYAVAYQNSELCILKEAVVDEDRLTINTAEQLVVMGTIETTRQTFAEISFVSH